MIKRLIGISFLALLAAGCMRQIAREQQNLSLPLTNSPPLNLDAAVARAAAEHKIVLIDFTGSDWCGPCMALHREVFARPEFESYAQSNLVFLVADFPARYRLSPEASATNDSLAAKFDVTGFPTLIALDGQGNKIWRQVGFLPGSSAKGMFATLDQVKAKAK
jgi:protein disulfide-isomerase